MLGEDEDEDQPIDGSGPHTGIQLEYVKKVAERLKVETTTRGPMRERWLLPLLEEEGANFWLRSDRHAKVVCHKVGLEYSEPAYYRDIKVWLPDVQFGPDAMPPCPHCKSMRHVSPHGWRLNHHARRVTDLFSHYYIMSRRYICSTCKMKRKAEKDALAAAAQSVGAHVDMEDEDEDEVPGATKGERGAYTFMGYDQASVPLLPHGRSLDFPAVLTYRGAVDVKVVSLMRPLFDAGVRPEFFSKMLLELHSKAYTLEHLKREHRIAASRSTFTREHAPQPFSTFGDKTKYFGLVPTGAYLQNVYVAYGHSIQDFMDLEVKKRGITKLCIDASYKEAKLLFSYNGKAVYHALVTGTNEFGEIRIQFHVVTDSHDQLLEAIKQMEATLKEYGHGPITLVFTDKPAEDKQFFLERIPSVQQSQDRFDLLAPPPAPAAGTCFLEESRYEVLESVQVINSKVSAMRSLMEPLSDEMRVVGLDAEWDTPKDANGFFVGVPSKVQVIQLAYCPGADTPAQAFVLQVGKLRTLPHSLSELFADPRFRFTGCGVAGDITRIANSFGRWSPACINEDRIVSLGAMAAARGFVARANAGLAHLVWVMLHEHLSKDPSVRCSKWSRNPLLPEQRMYAALDAVKSLEVYLRLASFPDLTKRILLTEVKPGLKVDVVPSHGSVASMASCAATATVLEDLSWAPPRGTTPSLMSKTGRRVVVQVAEVLAPALLVPGVKYTSSGEKLSLGDLGQPPFRVALPLTMLMHHVDRSTAEHSSDAPASAERRDPITRGAQPTVERAGGNAVAAGRVMSTLTGDNEDAAGGRGSDATALHLSQPDDSDDAADVQLFGDGAADDSLLDLNAADVELIRRCAAQGAAPHLAGRGEGTCPPLDPPPERIPDRFSAVLGDAFHMMDRPKVPMSHSSKKAYFVSLQEAFFAWDTDCLERVKVALRKDGMREDEIDAKMYYDVAFFRARVRRAILPPSSLYWRVRAVYELFGPMIDEETKAPLFNQASWKKANNVLNEILAGNISDPPGVSLYTQKLDAKGAPAYDRLGIALILCCRGTNRPESIHKGLHSTFYGWKVGVRFSDQLLRERRHRHNHSTSERVRCGFPKIGHFDTWLIDQLQLLVELNHGMLLYPEWVNTSDYKQTEERFGTIRLHSDALGDAIAAIPVSREALSALTVDQRYLCKVTGTQLPLLPVHGDAECTLFYRLILNHPGSFDADWMALEWCKHVDGKDIFPKLPVYLRKHHSAWLKSQQVKDAVRKAAPGARILASINARTAPSAPEAALALDPSDGDGHAGGDACDGPHQADAHSEPPACQPVQAAARFVWPPIQLPASLPLPPALNAGAHISSSPGAMPIVAGLAIGHVHSSDDPPARKRGRDTRPRKERTCKRCTQWGGVNAGMCKGRGPRGTCQYFTEHGEPVIP